jgi:hypothetical protein
LSNLRASSIHLARAHDCRRQLIWAR